MTQTEEPVTGEPRMITLTVKTSDGKPFYVTRMDVVTNDPYRHGQLDIPYVWSNGDTIALCDVLGVIS